MEKLTVMLLLASAVGANAASFPFILNELLRIDCGVKGKTTETYNNQTWYPDSFFIDPGKTKQITSSPNVPQVMTTLRYFPNGEAKNCYRLPLTNTKKFIFRAGFYYGNYDGKSQPPVFDLSLGGQPWATVNSSATADVPDVHELIYAPRNDNISVCLMGRKEYGSATPFISSLEATYLDETETANKTVYGMMRNGTAYHLVARLNFGGYDQVIEPWSGWSDTCEEQLNRYWTPQPMPGYTNLTFVPTTCTGTAYENGPPNSVINTAISPTNASQSIYVPVNFPAATPQSAYIVLYFYQDLGPDNVNATRNMDVYVDGVMTKNVKLQKYRSGEVVTLYPVLVQGTANVTISPANGTVLPPLLNGMEVFYATELAEEASSSNGVFKISYSVIVVGVCQLFVILFLGLV
ncbi:leucine-rich repeat receptor-like serine/threonine-protein kinase At2g14510 [Sesamum indicum]|uniref:Leucine-rich repeat receptor-like serine/threonine-protein kinase At2g14510 n=1 Tax=Sesamum indicum TaxID=4182 RepID=A0A8M8UW82_SESIN|nr:leucine-rich repeat receptor-like serine/threonine-protein kinase At2g14510 [Sesamum indicum]